MASQGGAGVRALPSALRMRLRGFGSWRGCCGRAVLPTLSAYLRCQGRGKEVAADLAVHPDTVRYRLHELMPFLDTYAGDGDQSAAPLAAVRIHEYLANSDTPGIRHDLHSRASGCI
jgi:hypothetical protein